MTKVMKWRGPLRSTGVSRTSNEPTVAEPNLAQRLPVSTRAARESEFRREGAPAWNSLGSSLEKTRASGAGERGCCRFCRRKSTHEATDARNETNFEFESPRPPTRRSVST